MKRQAASLILLLAASLSADVVHLNNGTSVEGTIKRDKGGWLITNDTGLSRFVSDAEVKSIQKASTLSPQALAESKLAAFRRSVDAISDPAIAIDRYEKFIEQNKDNPAADLARKDLAEWQQRRSQGLTRVGGKWLNADELAEAIKKNIEKIDQARNFIKDARLREATAVVDELLSLDKDNPSGLYLKALLAYKQDQLGIAKKHLEQLRTLLPEHAPTLNNLAVILSQQKQHIPALAIYEQAMLSAPRQPEILNNVAEALAALTDEQRQNPTARRVERKLLEFDAELQKEMETQGLYRWGSSYISREKMEEVKKAQAAVDEKINQLKADYEKISDRIKSIDNQLQANERTMAQIQRDRFIGDPRSPDIVVTPVPRAYYQLKRDSDKLQLERADLVNKLDTFPDKVQAVRQQTPLPQFTGRQKFIEAEGTPLATPRSPEPR